MTGQIQFYQGAPELDFECRNLDREWNDQLDQVGNPEMRPRFELNRDDLTLKWMREMRPFEDSRRRKHGNASPPTSHLSLLGMETGLQQQQCRLLTARPKRDDYEKLRQLSSRSNGKVVLEQFRGNPPYRYEIGYRIKSIVGLGFGSRPKWGEYHRAEIILSSNHPTTEPAANMLTPVFHPHVYPSWKICIGKDWIISEFLDDYVLRIGQILCFNPDYINQRSPANREALECDSLLAALCGLCFQHDLARLVCLSELDVADAEGSGFADTHSAGSHEFYRNFRLQLATEQCLLSSAFVGARSVLTRWYDGRTILLRTLSEVPQRVDNLRRESDSDC